MGPDFPVFVYMGEKTEQEVRTMKWIQKWWKLLLVLAVLDGLLGGVWYHVPHRGYATAGVGKETGPGEIFSFAPILSPYGRLPDGQYRLSFGYWLWDEKEDVYLSQRPFFPPMPFLPSKRDNGYCPPLKIPLETQKSTPAGVVSCSGCSVLLPLTGHRGLILINEIFQIRAAVPVEICHPQHLLSLICPYDTRKMGRKQGKTG